MKKIGIKRVGNAVISRRVLCAFTILLQFGWVVYITYRATVEYSIVDIILHVLAVILAFYVINRDMKPYFKLSWIFVILWAPIFGCPAYFMFGRPDMTKRARERMEEIHRNFSPYCVQNPSVYHAIRKENSEAAKQSWYLAYTAGFPVYYEEDTRYYASGEEMFPQMLEDLRQAGEFIFLEYFIIQPGKMFDSILEILEEKVKHGVKVRLIYDDIGSIKTLPPQYDRILKEKGIECVCFNPFRPFLAAVMNNRDHRKMMIIDGTIAYTGGINLADEYVNEIARFGYWKDAGIRFTGEAVWNLTFLFLENWEFHRGIHEDIRQYYPKTKPIMHTRQENISQTSGFVQPFGDGPLIREPIGENVYLNLIARAQKYVYIFTPYLIIDSEMETALINTAKSGIDVRIVTPDIPDKKMVFLLTQSHYESLIRGGVKIYQYTPGFIHSKCFIVDDSYAVVGSINLDFRSLYLHFECGVFLYRAKAVMQLKEDMDQTIQKSRCISLDSCLKRNFFVRLLQSVLHIFAPLF